MSFPRKSVVALIGVAGVVAAVLVSVAAAGSSSIGPPQLRVYGGGNIPVGSCTDGATPFCTQFTREFSLFAVHDPNENVTYGTLTFGDPEIDHGVRNIARVTCLAVSGNVAEGGAVITQSFTNPSQVGVPFQMFVRDSGQPGAVAPRDGVSPVFGGSLGDKLTCSNSDVASDAFGTGYFTLTYGDMAIQSITNQNG